MNAAERYDDALRRIPASGGGGFHQYLYRLGCLGFRAGKTVEAIIADILRHMPQGDRDVSDDEIEQGVTAAFEHLGARAGRRATWRPPAPRVAPDAMARLLRAGHGAAEGDIIRRSPVPLDWPPWEASWRVLGTLYAPDELLFVGDDHTPGILSRSIAHQERIVRALREHGSCPWPKFMVNPLSGQAAPKKTGGGFTLRGDGCVASHRFVVVEHDKLPLADQLAFWMAAPLPVSALIFSGKKSVHSWVRVDCADAAEWERAIERSLFPSYLTPLGFDPACRNASRLSRLPGHVRADTGQMQRCIYLAPMGKAVSG